MTVTVGQTLYVKPLGNLAHGRNGLPPMQCVVTKIGRKYYHITSDQGRQFKVPIGSNRFYDHDKNIGGILYTSVKLLEQADTDAEHLKAIRNYMNQQGNRKASTASACVTRAGAIILCALRLFTKS